MAKPNGVIYSSANSLQYPKLYNINHGAHPYKQGNGYLKFSTERLCIFRGKVYASSGPRSSSFICQSTETRNKETKKCTKPRDDRPDTSCSESGLERCVVTGMNVSQSQGIAEACKFAYNDAKYVNERAKKDLVLLSRGILRMDARARQDVAFLGSEFLKLDDYWIMLIWSDGILDYSFSTRAREDTEKIDSDVKRKAERLHHIAMILKNKAQSKLKTAADKHWSDGALEADLKRADSAAKQRAMEDSLMALEFVKNMHDMMVSKTNRLKNDRTRTSEVTERITLEKNGKTLDMEISAERIKALQEAYWDIASALSEADGIDYTDPEELELLVTTLIDLDAMDGKSSVSLLAEASSSPDDSTRKALANALSAAPSMWTLGNAGMGALQRLADDSNPAIAEAASKTIKELKKQWEIEEGDSWRFMMSQELSDEIDDDYEDANE